MHVLPGNLRMSVVHVPEFILKKIGHSPRHDAGLHPNYESTSRVLKMSPFKPSLEDPDAEPNV